MAVAMAHRCRADGRGHPGLARRGLTRTDYVAVCQVGNAAIGGILTPPGCAKYVLPEDGEAVVGFLDHYAGGWRFRRSPRDRLAGTGAGVPGSGPVLDLWLHGWGTRPERELLSGDVRPFSVAGGHEQPGAGCGTPVPLGRLRTMVRRVFADRHPGRRSPCPAPGPVLPEDPKRRPRPASGPRPCASIRAAAGTSASRRTRRRSSGVGSESSSASWGPVNTQFAHFRIALADSLPCGPEPGLIIIGNNFTLWHEDAVGLLRA